MIANDSKPYLCYLNYRRLIEELIVSLTSFSYGSCLLFKKQKMVYYQVIHLNLNFFQCYVIPIESFLPTLNERTSNLLIFLDA